MKIGATNLCVILVSPKGPLNVGGIARLMGNFGMRELRIVDSRCDLYSVDCKQMAMHSFHLIKDARHYPDFSSAIADLTQVVVLSGRRVEDRRPHSNIQNFPTEFKSHVSALDKVGLVFGREEIGLKLEELCLCRWQVEIPTHSDNFSINLTSAAAIAFSEFFRIFGEHSIPEIASEVRRPDEGKKEIFFQRLFKVLNDVKFLNKENPMHLRDDLWALMHRADLDEREMRILFGILTNIDQTIERLKKTDKSLTV